MGALIEVHAENNEIINTLTKEFLAEGKTDAWYHYASRPEFVEEEADKRAIAWRKPPAHRCISSTWRTKAVSRL